MLSYIKTAVLSLLSLIAVMMGLSALVFAPFLPMAFLDIDPPPAWINPWTMGLFGLVVMGSGIWLWAQAWKRWVPVEK